MHDKCIFTRVYNVIDILINAIKLSAFIVLKYVCLIIHTCTDECVRCCYMYRNWNLKKATDCGIDNNKMLLMFAALYFEEWKLLINIWDQKVSGMI